MILKSRSVMDKRNEEAPCRWLPARGSRVRLDRGASCRTMWRFSANGSAGKGKNPTWGFLRRRPPPQIEIAASSQNSRERSRRVSGNQRKSAAANQKTSEEVQLPEVINARIDSPRFWDEVQGDPEQAAFNRGHAPQPSGKEQDALKLLEEPSDLRLRSDLLR